MEDHSLKFLQDLLHSPAPSGYETTIQNVVRSHVGEFADDLRTDLHGNVIASVNADAQVRVMLDAHCDQIGLLVKHIDSSGYLYVDSIGGWDVQMLIGQELEVHTASGPVPGVIARKAIHLLTPEERKQVPEIKDLWVDIGASSKSQAAELVRIGDPVTLKLGYRDLQNGIISGPGMDDRVGVWVVMKALEIAAARGPNAAIYSVSSVQEEVGLRGARTSAFAIDAQVGIAVDVTHATDCPTIEETQYGEIHIGKGPVVFRGPNINPVVFDRLSRAAADNNIPIQVVGLSRAASNDGNAMQITRAGMATGIIGIPNRYMHSPVEIVSTTDLENAARLIAEFCLTVTAAEDFVPG